MQPIGFSQAHRLLTCGVAAIVAGLSLNSGNVLAVQEGMLPPIRPASVPETSPAFSPPPPAGPSIGDTQSSHAYQNLPPVQSMQRGQQTSPPLPANNDRMGTFDSNRLRGSIEPSQPSRVAPAMARQPAVANAAEAAWSNRGTRGNLPGQTPIVDRALQPAAFNAVPTSTTANSSAPESSAPNTQEQNAVGPNTDFASRLVEQLAAADTAQAIEGQPMELLDMLANADSAKQAELVQQYWKTWGAMAQYRFALDELQLLRGVGQVRNETSRVLLEAARSAASNAIAAREIDMVAQRQLLNGFLLGPRSELLPLPVDMPLVKGYRTNYEVYAAEQTLPDRLFAIHHLLPKQQQLIGDCAATVQRCRNAVMQSSRAFSQGAEPAASVLQAIQLCRNSHYAFVQTVVDYNTTIAEYAMAVNPFNTAPEQVVAMLIPVKATAVQEDAGDTELQQAALPDSAWGQPAAPQFQNRNTPRSFAPGTAASQPPGLDRSAFGGNANQGFQPAPAGSFRR